MKPKNFVNWHGYKNFYNEMQLLTNTHSIATQTSVITKATTLRLYFIITN